MSQRSLPRSTPREATGLVRIVGSAPALTAAQRKFNQLVERIHAQRQRLAEWRAYSTDYHAQLAERFQPALARLRKKQTALALLLDRYLAGTSLEKRERAKTRQMLLALLSQMLVETQEPALVQLYDKHAPRSFSDDQQAQRAELRELAGEEFGLDVDAMPTGESLDELAEWIDAQVDARSEPRAQTRPRRKSARTVAREAARAAAADGGTRAVRELFRKLASELHPDRETDPAEQARKTDLMQQVNQAYKAGNLLALLELQLSIEQIELGDLAALADERLRHYLFVLEEQSQRLRDELIEFVEPFARTLENARPERLTPRIVQQALQTDIRQLEAMARAVQRDVDLFKDLRTFQLCLRGYAAEPGDEADAEAPARRRGRGQRKDRS